MLWVYSTHFITGSIPIILAQEQTAGSVSGDASFLITVCGLGLKLEWKPVSSFVR